MNARATNAHVASAERLQVQPLPGVWRRTMTTTPGLMLCEFTLEKGSTVPTHSHRHEQIGYVISGRVRMTIAGVARDLVPGDAYAIPGDVPHSADALERSVVVDVFTPQREDYAGDLAKDG